MYVYEINNSIDSLKNKLYRDIKKWDERRLHIEGIINETKNSKISFLKDIELITNQLEIISEQITETKNIF